MQSLLMAVQRFALTLQNPREKQKPQAFDCNSYRLPMHTNLSHYPNIALSTKLVQVPQIKFDFCLAVCKVNAK